MLGGVILGWSVFMVLTGGTIVRGESFVSMTVFCGVIMPALSMGAYERDPVQAHVGI